MTAPKIMVVAGEASGDSHAARLVQAIRERCPEAEFYGIGGEALAGQGMQLACRAETLAVIGLTEVFEKIPAVWQALRTLWRYLRQERPQLVILVDFPDFNFLVARLAKWCRVPVMYYISPQVWAWRQSRVRTISRLVSRMVVIFPFEEEFYRLHGVSVSYVGHPLVETLPKLPPRAECRRLLGLNPQDLAVALLPGSRAGEIAQLLPDMLSSAFQLQEKLPRCRFLLPLAPTVPPALVQQPLCHAQIPVDLHEGRTFEVLAAADIALVASGTATLETALSGTPMVIVYRLAPLTYYVGRLLIRVPHIGIVNLLAAEGLFPELIQHEVTPANITAAALKLICEPEQITRISTGIRKIWHRLGGPGASGRAAAVALELLRK
ncbi:lipid-A-disaccharide synthase [Desulfobacca acetoxidans]|uniref:Lipid-A-disaccharide synthase n=1 Tax=Desulfobacca acetoxidans (strain ATCC 700848 / DSM 11109 / ASRB2) TaxID=880072 RepID=F2NCI6_DESAR|nr:lipid-A-disaccharide synthase [Desulfobacca acetoxidans]AEB09120.1 Lipid-A-disaccharide synthase [Desulfobacca acetoxidans DSM 11109]